MATNGATRRRWLKRISIGVAVLLGVLAALVLSVAVAAQTPSGRRAIANVVLDRVNAQIPGRMTVASVDAVTPSSLRGRGLRILGPRGNETLRADRFMVEFDMSRALAGDFIITSSVVDGGRVIIEELPNGRTRFEDAVSTGGGPRKPTPPITFRRIKFRNFALVIRLDGGPTFRLHGLHGALALGKVPMGAVRVDFMSIDGMLRTPGWNAAIGVRSVSGRLDADAGRMLELHGKAIIASDDPCAWSFTYGPHPRPWLHLAFEPEGVASGLLSAELHVAATLSPLLTME